MPSLLGRARLAPPPNPVVYRWDLDKTYLKSEFDSLRELVKIPFEKAEDKIAAPGVTALIRALRDTAERQQREIGVYFISASPPQIGRAIKQKLDLDGIVYDGIVFKDQLQRLMRGKFRHLREQVGYKITELLEARQSQLLEAREYLFGDDWESDPLIYSLYADVAAGRVDAGKLTEIMQGLRVEPTLIARAVEQAREVSPQDTVERIFINLERRTPPANFRAFGPRLVPTFNYLQTAVCLFEQRALDEAGLVQVARSLVEDSAYSVERLANSIADVERRGHVRSDTAVAARQILRGGGILPVVPPRRRERWRAFWRRWLGRIVRGRPSPPASEPAEIDYLGMIAGEIPATESRSG
jgi:hypothetical protein